MIPPFNEDGNLPPGIHEATLQEIEERLATTPRRRALMDGLRAAIDNLRMAGCQTVYIDGSLVTAKEEPKDWDSCWEFEGVDQRLLDPVLRTFSNDVAAQKRKYRGEIYAVRVGRGDVRYLEFFQRDRTGRRKGIIALNLRPPSRRHVPSPA
ncbi:MAG: hypothetical protein L0177_19130 [Chloroflexi bacterium]|nr:hypothetical protein [Chloroflexota bacterium]